MKLTRHIFALFLCLLLLHIQGFGKHKSQRPKITIYFRPNDCVKCYMPLEYINALSQKVKIECIAYPDEKDYILQLLQEHHVDAKAYTMRNISSEEKTIYKSPLSTYIFQSEGISLFGDYILLDYIHKHLDDLLTKKALQARIFSKGEGFIPMMPAFGLAGNKSITYDEKLSKLYIDSVNGGNTEPGQRYFNSDSTVLIFKADSGFRKMFLQAARGPEKVMFMQVWNISSWRNKPLFLGRVGLGPTPLYRNKKQYFLSFYRDTVISRSQFTYIDNSKPLQPDIIAGLSYDHNAPELNSYYSLVWQPKRKPDSFYVGRYVYHPQDTTWYQDHVYLLDTARTAFDYNDDMQFISGNYVIHSDLPLLYHFPEVQKTDLSNVLSFISQRDIVSQSRLPHNMSIAGLWNDGVLVKLIYGSPDGLQCLTYHPDFGIYEIQAIPTPYAVKELKQLSFDNAGKPVVLFQHGRQHEVWRFE